ncbi:znc transporter [mine drainage metagenome]|uniref:Znc transporter n=1 Tax=mine drainage metagenome TaxID=410659 RepID=T1BQ76_9ZZZZ
MADLPLFLSLTAVMGLSILLSLPLVYSPRAQGRWAVALSAAAIGILLFLLADVFSDAAQIIYPAGYVANPRYAVAFAVAFGVAFLGLHAVDSLPRRAGRETAGAGALRMATIVAIGIGLQNLTEGLVFGVNWTLGNVGVLAVVFLGFVLQNITEGFPIAAPFLGAPGARRADRLVGLYLLGGLPTIVGGLLGYVWSSDLFLVIFDAAAVGAIAYIVLPMLRFAFRPLEDRAASVRRDRIVYLGVVVGFLIGFAVNAL